MKCLNDERFNEHELVISRIADTQGEIYDIAYELGYDLEDFSNKYLTSSFCELEMDSVYSYFQYEFGKTCMEEIEAEFAKKSITVKKTTNKNIYYSPSRIGKIYRYLFYKTKTMSKDLLNEYPFEVVKDIEIEMENDEMDDILEYIVGKNYDSYQKIS